MSDIYLVIEPTGNIRWERIDHASLLDRLHHIIDCQLVECVHSIFDGISLIVDESGKIKSPPKAFNRTASWLYPGYVLGDEFIAGTVVLAAVRVDPESIYGERDWFGLDFFDIGRLRDYGLRIPRRPEK